MKIGHDEIIEAVREGKMSASEAVKLMDTFEIHYEPEELLGFEKKSSEGKNIVEMIGENAGKAIGKMSEFARNLGDEISKNIDKTTKKAAQKASKASADDGGEKKKGMAIEIEMGFNDEEEASDKKDGFDLSIEVGSADIYVSEPSTPIEKIDYEFVNEDTGEVIDIPESISVKMDKYGLKIKEDGFGGKLSKFANTGFGKKVVEIFGMSNQGNGDEDGMPNNICLNVFLPKGKKIDAAKFSTDTRKINIEGISTIETMSVSTISGSVRIRDTIAEKMRFGAVSGDIDVRNYAANSLTVDMVSGNVDINGKTPKVNANTVSGNLRFVNDMLLYDSTFDSVSGNIRCYIEGASQQNYSMTGLFKNAAKNNKSDGEKGSMIRFSTVSGSSSVHDRSEA